MKHFTTIPELKAFVRNEYLYDHKQGHGEYTPAIICAAKSQEGRALNFTCLLDTGALFSGLPAHAFLRTPAKPSPELPLDYLQLWDCLAGNIEFETINLLAEKSCVIMVKDRSMMPATYITSCVWDGSMWTDYPEEDKTCHLLWGENGQLFLQPSNRVRFYDQSFTVNQDKELDYKVHTHVYHCERNGRWVAENSDRFEYGMKWKNHPCLESFADIETEKSVILGNRMPPKSGPSKTIKFGEFKLSDLGRIKNHDDFKELIKPYLHADQKPAKQFLNCHLSYGDCIKVALPTNDDDKARDIRFFLRNNGYFHPEDDLWALPLKSNKQSDQQNEHLEQ